MFLLPNFFYRISSRYCQILLNTKTELVEITCQKTKQIPPLQIPQNWRVRDRWDAIDDRLKSSDISAISSDISNVVISPSNKSTIAFVMNENLCLLLVVRLHSLLKFEPNVIGQKNISDKIKQEIRIDSLPI